jgi:hypothetical protein
LAKPFTLKQAFYEPGPCHSSEPCVCRRTC